MPEITIHFSNEQYKELQEIRLEYRKNGFMGDTGDLVKFILQMYGLICFSETVDVVYEPA